MTRKKNVSFMKNSALALTNFAKTRWSRVLRIFSISLFFLKRARFFREWKWWITDVLQSASYKKMQGRSECGKKHEKRVFKPAEFWREKRNFAVI